MTTNDIIFIWGIVSIPLVLVLSFGLVKLTKITKKLNKTVKILKKYIENLKETKWTNKILKNY